MRPHSGVASSGKWPEAGSCPLASGSHPSHFVRCAGSRGSRASDAPLRSGPLRRPLLAAVRSWSASATQLIASGTCDLTALGCRLMNSLMPRGVRLFPLPHDDWVSPPREELDLRHWHARPGKPSLARNTHGQALTQFAHANAPDQQCHPQDALLGCGDDRPIADTVCLAVPIKRRRYSCPGLPMEKNLIVRECIGKGQKGLLSFRKVQRDSWRSFRAARPIPGLLPRRVRTG